MGRDRSTKMRCLVSDDTGLIKVVNLDGKGKVVQTMGKQSKERRVASLCWAAPDESMVAAGCKDGVIRLWRPTDGSAAGELETGEEDLVSVRMITKSGVCTLVSAHKGGKCGAWRLDEDNEVDSCLFDVPGPVTVMDTSDINGTVLFGGKEREVDVWDLESRTKLWTARNVPHDNLDVRQPVWIKGANFFPDDPNKIAIATAYQQVRIYDIRVKGRRPVSNWKLAGDGYNKSTQFHSGTRAFTALSLLGKQGNNAFVGDTVGNVMLIDTRTGKLVRKLHGMTGSIVACAAHCAAPIGVVAARDRWVRAFDLQRKRVLTRVYLKQIPSGLLLSREPPKPKEEIEAEEEAKLEIEAQAGGDDDISGDEKAPDEENEDGSEDEENEEGSEDEEVEDASESDEDEGEEDEDDSEDELDSDEEREAMAERQAKKQEAFSKSDLRKAGKKRAAAAQAGVRKKASKR